MFDVLEENTYNSYFSFQHEFYDILREKYNANLS